MNNAPENVWTTGAHWREHSGPNVFNETSQSGSLFAGSVFIVPDHLPPPSYDAVRVAEGPSNLAQALTTKKRYSSSPNDLMGNRTRRIFTPVNGNNKVGKRGKIRCKECRRIHIKGVSLDKLSNIQCVYDSDESTCENCSSKGLECVKVWGPKTEAWLNAVTATINQLAVPPSVSVIADTNLTYQENSRLRRIYRYTLERRDNSDAIILQHLWNVCSSTFDDEALLYSILAWDAARDRSASVTELDQYCYRFQKHLRHAMQRDAVVELHLFAVIFAVMGVRNQDSQGTLAVHLKGMVGMLHHFNSPRFQGEFRLRYLHHYAVSWSRGYGPTAVCGNAYEIHVAAQMIPVPLTLPDPRIAVGPSVQAWGTERDIPDEAILWSMWDEHQGLYGCFEKLLEWEIQKGDRSDSDFSNIAALIRSIRSNAERLKMHPRISTILERVSSSSIPGTDR